MTTLIIGIILIVVTALLVLVVLIQNPKGGGLSSSFGAASNQFMDVKKTGDFLERSTWVFFAALLVLCLSFTSISNDGGDDSEKGSGSEFVDKMKAKAKQQAPAAAPTDAQQAPADSAK